MQPHSSYQDHSNHRNGIEGLYRFLVKSIENILVCLLISMAIAIGYQIISRFLFDSPSKYTQEFLRYALIWLGLLGGGYGFLSNRHLNLPILIEKLGSSGARKLNFFNLLIITIFGFIVTIAGYQAYVDTPHMKTAMFQVPLAIMQLSMVFCGLIVIAAQFRIISSSFNNNEVQTKDVITVSILGSLLFLLVAALVDSTYFIELRYTHLEALSLVILFGSFFIFLLLGTPIAVGLAFSGLLTLALQVDVETLLPTAGQTLFNGLDSFGFLALPFFILAGSIMNRTGLARRLIDLAMILGGKIPGSLWQSNVVANVLFGTLSGSGIASASAIGGIITPIARERSYNMPMTAAVNAASAPSGMLIPPSGALIVYSLITGGSASIISLFMAGYIPGLIMALAVMISAFLYAKKNNYPIENSTYSWSHCISVLLHALPSLVLIIIVIGGILGGIFTAIEGSGVAVIYSFVLALVYRSLSLKVIFEIFLETATISGVILFLIACSAMMSWTMTFASIPDTVGHLITGFSESKYTVLLLIVAILLIVGVFMDMSPAMLIFTPIFFPVVTALGVNPVHFGIIVVYALSLGVITPPVGTVLFVACSISDEKIASVIKPLTPIFLFQLLGLLLVVFFPKLSLWLPSVLMLL